MTQHHGGLLRNGPLQRGQWGAHALLNIEARAMVHWIRRGDADKAAFRAREAGRLANAYLDFLNSRSNQQVAR